FGVQNFLLLAAAQGLATHRTFGPNLVPEAVINFVASSLGPSYREGELVQMLAIGHPEEPSAPVGRGIGAQGDGWEGCPPAELQVEAPPEPAAQPTPLLRSSAAERVSVVDPYRYNREHLARLLGAAGYEVETFIEGRALLARIDDGATARLYVVSDSL